MLLQGELDPQTAHGYADVAHKHYPSSQYVSVPFAVHKATMNSVTDAGANCGLDIMLNWMETGYVDASCIPSIAHIDFDGKLQETQNIAEFLLNNPRLW